MLTPNFRQLREFKSESARGRQHGGNIRVREDTSPMYFRVYLDDDSRWRWALYSGRNERIAVSPDSYPSIEDVGRGIGLVMSADSATRVVEPGSDERRADDPGGRPLQ